MQKVHQILIENVQKAYQMQIENVQKAYQIPIENVQKDLLWNEKFTHNRLENTHSVS